ncbi:MAG TPA: hypothetical protein VM733_21545 [Thermoanaerobaculia bacterium]|nr:hypothetical protein [Thermoanaerobaculia bacterium]
MRKTAKFTMLAAGALTLTSMFGMTAFGDDRRDNDNWRDRRDSRYDRRDDRDFLRGEVERVDRRSGVVVVRTNRSSRPVLVQMTRRGTRGIDASDLRRGDYVTFVGDWSRNGTFTAWRVDDVRSRR